jgi:hypothetical protein
LPARGDLFLDPSFHLFQHGTSNSRRWHVHEVVKPHVVIGSCPVSHLSTPSQLKLTVSSAAVTKSSEYVKLASSHDKVVVLIHKELLCFYSSYYNAALNGNFLEAQKDRFDVDLSGENLMRFATWIYTGEVTEAATFRCIIHLYMFAGQMDIMALRRNVVGGLIDTGLMMYDQIKLIVLNLTHNSPLRKFVLDSYVSHWEPTSDYNDPCVFDSDTDPDNHMATFTYQVMKGIAVRKKDQGSIDCPCCSDPCEYHEHESKEGWKASMLT